MGVAIPHRLIQVYFWTDLLRRKLTIDGGIKCGNELTVPLKENRNKHLSAPGRDESILKIKLMGIIIKENIGRHKKF